jgi:hypothetical protein
MSIYNAWYVRGPYTRNVVDEGLALITEVQGYTLHRLDVVAEIDVYPYVMTVSMLGTATRGPVRRCWWSAR